MLFTAHDRQQAARDRASGRPRPSSISGRNTSQSTTCPTATANSQIAGQPEGAIIHAVRAMKPASPTRALSSRRLVWATAW